MSATSLTVRRTRTSRRRGAVVPDATTALDAVTFDIRSGEILGIIGESGSGKSTLLKTICGLLRVTDGSLLLGGTTDLGVRLRDRDARVVRRIQMVMQNPDDSLNPAHTVRRVLAGRRRGRWGWGRARARDRERDRRRPDDAALCDLLASVGLEPRHLGQRSTELSGGEKQRVAIARSLMADPELLLLDEVTSALDVTVQAGVLDTLRAIHDDTGTTMVLVSHDLAVVASMADRIAVLRRGRLVEIGASDQVIEHPADDYTARLLALVRESETDGGHPPSATRAESLGQPVDAASP